MNEEVLHTIIFAGLFLGLFAMGELFYHKLKLPVEITRKFVHLGSGIICLTFPFFLTSHWSVLFLTLSFAAILILSLKFNTLKSIHKVDRITRGSYLFPMIIYINFWIYLKYGVYHDDITLAMGLPEPGETYDGEIFFCLPILILAVSDPLAAIFGKKWPKGKYKVLNETKTLVGSAAFFISAFILSAIMMLPLAPTLGIIIGLSAMIACAATFVEAISQKGFDNLLIPLAAAGVLILFKDWLYL